MANLTGTFYEGDAIHGYGTELQVGDAGSPETFESIADVISITPGDMTTAVIEKTHLRSPEAHREKLAGLRDSGPFTVVCNYRPDHESHSNAGGGSGSFTGGGLFAIWRSREERNYKIVINDASPSNEFPFTGIITRCQLGEIGPDSKIELTVEFTPISDFSADLP
jgi:hypothetical protein